MPIEVAQIGKWKMHRILAAIVLAVFALNSAPASGQGKTLKIPLTAKQATQLSKATRGEVVTVTLTSEQYKAIKKRFPKLANNGLRVTLSASKQRSTSGLSFGDILSAAVSGINQDGEAIASLSESGAN